MRSWRAALFSPAGVLMLPALVVVTANAAMLALASRDKDPFWPVRTLTLAEAAALHDRGDVTHLIDGGADADASYAVRPGIIDERPHVLTPLAAAVMARQGDMIPLLIRRGAHIDAATWRELACLARQLDMADVVQVLDGLHPDGAVLSCGEGVPGAP